MNVWLQGVMLGLRLLFMKLSEFTVAVLKGNSCYSYSSFTAFPQTDVAILAPCTIGTLTPDS